MSDLTSTRIARAFPTITLEKLDPDATFARQTDHAAAYDLVACLNPRDGTENNLAVRSYSRENVELPVYAARWTTYARMGAAVVEGQPAGPRSLILSSGHRALVPLGVKVALPADRVAYLALRSGAALKTGLMMPHGFGIIDADYPDEWYALVRNTAPHAITINHGDRLFQAVIHRKDVLDVVEGSVGQSTNRTGGFGSTNR